MKTGWSVRGVACPRCGEYSLVYNGTYWCEAGCEWVMGEAETKADRHIIKTYLIQCWHEADAKGDEDEKRRLETYLIEYADE